jgi:hypothetical protein
VLFRLGDPAPAESSAMLTRLICQDLLAADVTRNGTGADGDGLIWLAECAALPRQPVTDLIARGQPAGLPVLAATTSAPVAADLADLVNVVVAHRMADSAAARRLAAVAAAAARPGLDQPPEPEAAAAPRVPGSGVPGSGAAGSGGLGAGPAALRAGEFLLAVQDPPRLVPSGLLVRARVPQVTRDARAAAPRRAWEGA